jgi:hypothetical protein
LKCPYIDSVAEGQRIILKGLGWQAIPIKIDIDGKPAKIARILQGTPAGSGRIIPDPTSIFIIMISTIGLILGSHKVRASSTSQIHPQSTTQSFEVKARRTLEADSNPGNPIGIKILEKPYLRLLDFFNRRFGHIGFIPPGVRETQIRQIRLLHEKRKQEQQQQLKALPVPGVCNWTPAGPGPVPKGQTETSSNLPTQPVAGRTLAIAIDPNTPSTVYIGTANGGIWKSTDNGKTWSSKTDYNRSLAIDALAIDPNNSMRIFAGTGEYNNIGGGTYYGNGLLKSENSGNTWAEIATSTFERDEISKILFDTNDSSHLLLSSSIGVFESLNGGDNWTLLKPESASDHDS